MSKRVQPIKVIIADQQELFRDGFKLMLEREEAGQIELIAEAKDGIEIIEKVKKLQPDVVLMDINLPKLDGLHATNLIKTKYPKINVIAFSTTDDEHTILSALRAGAIGYLLKDSRKEEIVEAIRKVSTDSPYYCTSISNKLFQVLCVSQNEFQKTKKIKFTAQEIKVIQLICKQLTTKEIALDMKLCTRTIEDYKHNIQEKIDARNVVGIALFAVENSIIKLSDLP